MTTCSLGHKILIIVSFLTAVFFTTAGYAQGRGSYAQAEKSTGAAAARPQQQEQTSQFTTPRLITDFGPGIQTITPGLEVTNGGEIYNQLLNVSVDSPTWPSFPRNWHEESLLKTVETSTYMLPSLKVINGGVDAEYRYARKITLVMMKSLHKHGAPVGSPVYPEAYKMTIPDPENPLRRAPNLQPGYPMVGFCSFELQLTVSNGQSFGVEFFNTGVRKKLSEARVITQTVFSKFFRIPPNKNILTIMNNYCVDTFTKYVRPHVEANFVPVIVEEIYLHSPQNQCHPNPKDSAAGDADCMGWFAGFDRVRKHNSVPRCVTVKDGFNVCRLKAKEGRRCPLYEDKNGQRHTDVTQHGLHAVTKTKFASPCDTGLTCKVAKEPKSALFGLIEFQGDSFCAK